MFSTPSTSFWNIKGAAITDLSPDRTIPGNRCVNSSRLPCRMIASRLSIAAPTIVPSRGTVLPRSLPAANTPSTYSFTKVSVSRSTRLMAILSNGISRLTCWANPS